MRNQKESVLSSQNQPASQSKRLHLDPLAWLLEREVFEPKVATGLQDVLDILKESGKDENEADVDSDHNLHDSDSEHNLHDSDSEHNNHDDSASSDEPAPTDKKD